MSAHKYGWPRTAFGRGALVWGALFTLTQATWLSSDDNARVIGLAILIVAGLLATLATIVGVSIWISRGEGGSDDPNNPARDTGW